MNIDLNADVAEGCGQDDKLLTIVSSANVCCGLHAGSYAEMIATLQLAKKNNVRVGAHPGLDDRENFGRTNQSLGEEEYRALMAYQLGATKALCNLVGVSLDYVKPHGALANLAARDEAVAAEIASTVAKIDPGLAILAISGTELEQTARKADIPVYSEIFADRGYLKSGQLVPRGQDGAMIHDAQEAAERLIEFFETGLMPVIDGEPIPLAADSICVHGDSESAVGMAREIRRMLLGADITVSPFIIP